MKKLLDIRSLPSNTAPKPRDLPFAHTVANDSWDGHVSALAKRWMR